MGALRLLCVKRLRQNTHLLGSGSTGQEAPTPTSTHLENDPVHPDIIKAQPIFEALWEAAHIGTAVAEDRRIPPARLELGLRERQVAGQDRNMRISDALLEETGDRLEVIADGSFIALLDRSAGVAFRVGMAGERGFPTRSTDGAPDSAPFKRYAKEEYFDSSWEVSHLMYCVEVAGGEVTGVYLSKLKHGKPWISYRLEQVELPHVAEGTRKRVQATLVCEQRIIA